MTGYMKHETLPPFRLTQGDDRSSRIAVADTTSGTFIDLVILSFLTRIKYGLTIMC